MNKKISLNAASSLTGADQFGFFRVSTAGQSAIALGQNNHADQCDYCVKGFNIWMDDWKDRGWCRADKKPVKNRHLRQQAAIALYLRFSRLHISEGQCDVILIADRIPTD